MICCAGLSAWETSAPRARSLSVGDERLDHRQRDVGLQQREADLARGGVDVGVGEPALAAELGEDPGEAVTQGVKHGEHPVCRHRPKPRASPRPPQGYPPPSPTAPAPQGQRHTQEPDIRASAVGATVCSRAHRARALAALPLPGPRSQARRRSPPDTPRVRTHKPAAATAEQTPRPHSQTRRRTHPESAPTNPPAITAGHTPRFRATKPTGGHRRTHPASPRRTKSCPAVL